MIMTRTRPGGGPEDFRTRRPVCRPRFRRVRAARAHRPAGGLVTPGPPSPGRVRWRSPPGGDSESGKLAAAAPGRGGHWQARLPSESEVTSPNPSPPDPGPPADPPGRRGYRRRDDGESSVTRRRPP